MRYKIERKLGSGATGEVWRGHHPGLGIPVAIKILSPALVLAENSSIRRFMREARTVAQINHPNVVRIYDADHADHKYFIVMELVSGGTTRDLLIRSSKGLPLDDAVTIVAGVARGLRAAARYKIIHRDIKPANIMLDEEGIPKLLDLGLAKQWGAPTSAELSLTPGVVGTPFYMAPEQVLNSPSLDARADIYSLGITFYHFVTGTVPFKGKSAYEIMSKHVSDPLPDPKAKNPDVPDSVCAVIERMTANKPEERYQNVDELLQDLELFKPGSAASRHAPLYVAPPTPVLSGAGCPKCHAAVEDAARFCGKCGAELRHPCPECANDNEVHLVFCPGCGTNVKLFLELEEVARRTAPSVREKRWQQVIDGSPELPDAEPGLQGSKGQKLIEDLRARRQQAKNEMETYRQLREEVHALMEQGKYSDALDQVNACLSHNPHDESVKVLLPQLTELRSIQETSERYVALGRHMAAKRYNEARALLTNAEELCKDVSDPDEVMCELTDDSGQMVSRPLTEMLAEMPRWLEEIEQAERTALNLANGAKEAAQEGRLEEAEKTLAEACEVYPEHADCAKALAEIEQARRKMAEAKERLARLHECFTKADFIRADKLIAEVKALCPTVEGLEEQEQRLRKLSEDYERQLEMITTSRDAKDLTIALAAAVFALKLCPESRKAQQHVEEIAKLQARALRYWHKARKFADSARFEKAREQHSQAREIWPGIPQMASCENDLAAMATGYQEAVEETTAALKRNKFVAARDACARALVLCGASEQALELQNEIEKTREITIVKRAKRRKLRRKAMKLSLYAAAVILVGAVLFGGVLSRLLKTWFVRKL